MTKKKHSFSDYLKPKTLVMLALGFSSGLPFLLVGNTFGYWLRDEGTSLKAIGFISWVGIAYSLQFLWAPLQDVTYWAGTPDAETNHLSVSLARVGVNFKF